MSGICGIFNIKDDYIDKSLLIKMLNIIDHRGPDKKSLFIDRSIGFGHCLLKLKPEDLSVRPIKNEDNSIFSVMDGYIFNYQSLRNLLERNGHKFNSDTHDEIVVHLYETYGENFPTYIDGDFSCALWDSRKQQLVLVKDIISHKNIYFTSVDGNFIFSSEMKSLLTFPGIKRNLDYKSIREYLALLHIIHPHTFFLSIKRISPGYLMIVNKKQTKTKRYWGINLNKTIENTEDYFIKKILYLISESTKKRLQLCDYKNFGLFLSGGLDSTTLLYFLDKFSEKPVDTYTIGIRQDLRYSRIAADFFNTNHHEYIPNSRDILKISSKAIWNIEMPRTVGFFIYLLPVMSQNKKYVFFGEGSEELFFGRDDHPILRNIGFIRKIPKFIRKTVKPFTAIPNSKIKRLTSAISDDFYEFYVKYRDRFTKKEDRLLLNLKVSKHELAQRLKKGIDKKLSNDFLKNFAYLDLDVWFFSQPYFCYKQEVGNQFIDHNLLQFSFSIPSRFKVKKNMPRYLLKKAMKDKIPDEIVHRKWEPWDLQENWIEGQKEILSYFIEKLKDRNIINKKYEKISEFVEKNSSYPLDHKVWNLFTTEIFCEVFIDRDKLKEPKKLSF